ncbi:bifunctional [glutamine synthetase] adenylyltransferase/[glutamine synthetase]-adenylyl-L-tyrosine phosphorylase [Lentilitoribacter sp. EG35]|uniref:bifunctional [glutamine synthetase] adenylyltransferase/[glutamine synthetase]-adenylyl-L-tyrosine phosphorylase n=1 Tax=Lentilitoribacter sp. EG35 TaxID=3234192 RepID=UPI003460ABDD
MMKLINIKKSPVLPRSKKSQKEVASHLSSLRKEEPKLAKILSKKTDLFSYLTAALSHSPYLLGIVCARPILLANTLENDLPSQMKLLLDRAGNAWLDDKGQPATEAETMRVLREVKREASLALAFYDLAQISNPQDTTRYLSELAAASLKASFNHLLLEAHGREKLRLKDINNPSDGSGLVVLGMGKLGADELNYSSDIDIVVFFDRAADIVSEDEDATDIFAKITRRLIHIMQHHTAHGYVFRTDLRLRPDPGSTPLAFSIEAALNYYEGRGQNWERAAFIKARPVAGDIQAGEQFIKELQPFMFRKFLDYAAIADINSIKRQINAHRGLGDISVPGHNVKLGRGGIREIEFFAQTQQLIAGGRNPDLRQRRTDEAINALVRAKWLDQKIADGLKQSYWYLRNVEHRIQMVDDQQSHELPEEKSELKTIALMMGEDNVKDFRKTYTKHLKYVESVYAELFEQEEQLTGDHGNLLFTGEDDDPSTLKTLSEFGFERPSDISRVVRNWHRGRYRATRSTQAIERLTELTPQLLQTFGKAQEPDDALLKFDAFLSGLPAGIQLFSLLGSNPGLLSLLQTIMTCAPRLADIISRRPHIFDGLLDPAVLSELPTPRYLQERLATFLKGAIYYEDVLDRLRIFCAEQRFLIGIRLLTGAISGMRAGVALSDLADLMISHALNAVIGEMEAKHGKISGGQVAILGMGKIASREMTAGSDVDMILIYNHDSLADESDGEKPLDPVRYYMRLTQRLIAAISAPTAEGVLYEVDLRLRPSGNKGPVATSLKAFSKYQRDEAWVWEHMALSRARCVAGSEELINKVHGEIHDILAAPRTHSELVKEIADMRKLIDEEKPPKDDWDFKLIPGGLIDIEFMMQYLSLRERGKGWQPPMQETGTSYLIEILGIPHLGNGTADHLMDALKLWTNISQVTKLCVEGSFDQSTAPQGLMDLILKSVHMPDKKMLDAEIESNSKMIRDIFKEVVRH